MSLADPAYSTMTDDLHKMSILVLHNHVFGNMVCNHVPHDCSSLFDNCMLDQ